MRNLRWSRIEWWRSGDRPLRPGEVEPEVVQRGQEIGGTAAPPQTDRPSHAAGIYSRLGVPRSLNYPSTTLGRLLDQTADRFAESPALIYQDQTWTYQQLLSYTNRIAGGLAALGVRPGDRVVLTLPNCPEYIGSFFAIQKLGAIVVNAGPLVGHDDLVALLRKTQPRLLIGLDLQSQALTRGGAEADASEMRWLWVSLSQYQSALKRVGYQIRLWQTHHPDKRWHTRFDVMLQTAPSRPPTVAPEPDEVAVLQLTSGTTGSLKIAMLTHRSLLANATQVSIPARMHMGQARVLGLLPMFHVYGLTMCLTSVVYTGGCVLPFTRFSAVQMLDAVLEFKPTVMCVVPAMADAFCDLLEQRDAEPVRDALRECIVISGSAPLTPATAHRFEQLVGVPMLQGYGLTEASPVTHCNPPDDPRDNSVGVPLPDTQVKLVDLDDASAEVEPGRTGVEAAGLPLRVA
ncbi:MAG: AMP-binding protein, partial [Phycisphaeraceae bacterium]